MTETALITGATAGLGAEFARQLAAGGHNLVLVARDLERLQQTATDLGQEFGVVVETIQADLLTEAGVTATAERLVRTQDPVTLLVNNAGFGLRKRFEAPAVQDELDMLNILVQVPLRLTHAALAQMLARGEGRILNVASMAAFVPTGTYAAAKAWVLSFSRWANRHYRGRGVTVTALCPGFVHTEFHERMGVSEQEAPEFMWLQPEPVVREGLRDCFAGKAVSIPSKRYKLLSFFAEHGPKTLLSRLGGRRG